MLDLAAAVVEPRTGGAPPCRPRDRRAAPTRQAGRGGASSVAAAATCSATQHGVLEPVGELLPSPGGGVEPLVRRGHLARGRVDRAGADAERPRHAAEQEPRWKRPSLAACREAADSRT